jgi:hypothetical protein
MPWIEYTIFVFLGVFVLASLLSLYSSRQTESFTSTANNNNNDNVAYTNYYNRQYPLTVPDSEVKSLMKTRQTEDKERNIVIPPLSEQDNQFQKDYSQLVQSVVEEDNTFDSGIMEYQLQNRDDSSNILKDFGPNKINESIGFSTTSKQLPKQPTPKNSKLPEPDPSIPSPYGYVYMPNRLWRSNQFRAPVCYSNTTNIVQPVYTNGSTSDLLEFTGIGSIMPTFEYKEVPGKLNEKEFFESLNSQQRNQWAIDSHTS